MNYDGSQAHQTGIRQFQYLTLPLTVGADHANRMLRRVLERAFGQEAGS